MADKKITQLNNITGADLADADEFVVVDITSDETKAITFNELKTAFDTGTGFVRVTGDTMTGALNVESTITSDGLTVDGTSQTTSLLVNTGSTAWADSNADDLIIRGTDVGITVSSSTTGSINFGDSTSATKQGQITYTHSGDNLDFYTATNKRLGIAGNGDISFYEDTGTTAKFFWDASAESLGIGTSSPKRHLHLNNPAALTTKIQITNLTTGASTDGDGFQLGISNDGTANIEQRENLDMAFATNNTEAMRIDASGQVGIGTSSPDVALDVIGTTTSGIRLKSQESSSNGFNIYNDSSTDTAHLNNHFNGSMIFSTNNTERMRIDSSGNVGIGVVPSRKLHVVDTSGGNIALLSNGVDADLNINLTSGVTLLTPSTGTLAFGTSSTERMRIDSSGNLLVGTTSSNYGAVGSQIGTGGNNYMTRSGAQPLLLNRLSSDGDILLLMKDGTTVGSIGYNLSALTLDGGSSRSGLYFGDGAILPRYNSSLVNGVNADLGATAQRYQDLYLSGGVYLGGTGSANKLDDYEEGTWTPAFGFDTPATGITFSEQQGTYTKVGRLVTVQGVISLSSKGSGGSGRVQITGIPFNSVGSGANQYSGSVEVRFTTINGVSVHAEIGRAGNYIRIMESRSELQVREITEANCANNSGFLFTITYETA